MPYLFQFAAAGVFANGFLKLMSFIRDAIDEIDDVLGDGAAPQRCVSALFEVVC